VQFNLQGTSNSTSISFTVPYIQQNNVDMYEAIRARNNGGSYSIGLAYLNANSSNLICYLDADLTGWTASGNKRVMGNFVYESA